jgi:hypothetical protein
VGAVDAKEGRVKKNVLSIDPSLGRTGKTGHARFVGGELVACGFDMPTPGEWSREVELVVIEWPRWYGPGNRVDVKDLMDLRERATEMRCYYLGLGLTVDRVWPQDWKGTVPPDIMQGRILSALTDAESALVPLRPRAKDVDHNLADAIGLGLWKLGRLR